MKPEHYLTFPQDDHSSCFQLIKTQEDNPPDHRNTCHITYMSFSELCDYLEEVDPDNADIKYEAAAMGIGDTLLKGFSQASWNGLIILRIK